MSDKLYPFMVSLHEDRDDKFQIMFECSTEDADHAAEQAENAYPNGEVLNVTRMPGDLPIESWLRNLAPGSEVWWTDPDEGFSSGYYTVDSINADEVDSEDTVIILKTAAGGVAEVFAGELKPSKPSKPAELHRLRLTMDVTYDLNEVDIDDLVRRLRKMGEWAVGEGMLTGETEAEVDQYSMDVTEYPEGDEDEIADFMQQRIEDGDLDLEDIPVRLARYGLMDPADFINEMRERMAGACIMKADSKQDQPEFAHMVKFEVFVKEAEVVKLENHGRDWETFFRGQSLGFSDGSIDQALRMTHEREVNNALYRHSKDAPDWMAASPMPPAEVLAEYPEVVARFEVRQPVQGQGAVKP